VTPLSFVSRLKLWRCSKVGARVEVLGSVYVVGGGYIEIGDDVVLDGRVVPVELHAGPAAVLTIGHGCVLEGGVSVEAQQRVQIGPGSRLRAFAKVMDNNFHAVTGSRHKRPASQPVKLEAAVEVGERAIVLPGAWLEAKVTLGPGVVIARRVKSGMTVHPPKPRPESPRVADQDTEQNKGVEVAVEPEPENGSARPKGTRARGAAGAEAVVVVAP
jgi:acetyltransferase-like isoleucine patch superfamily enzyme